MEKNYLVKIQDDKRIHPLLLTLFLFFYNWKNMKPMAHLQNSSFSSYFCTILRINKSVSKRHFFGHHCKPMKKRIPFLPTLSKLSTPLLLIFSIFLFAGSEAFGVTKTSMTSGTWASITWSPVGLPVAGDDIIINTNVTTGPAAAIANFASLTVNSGFTFTHTATAITLTGNLQVDGTYQLTNQALTVNGTALINGTLNDNNTTGLNRIDGLFTVGGSGVVSNTNNPTYEFRGGITNNGSFTISGSGITTFSTNNQTVQGNTLTFGPVTVGTGITVSSSGAVPVTINGAIVLTGNIDFTGAGLTTFASLTCSGAGNITLQSVSMAATATISQTGTFTVLGTTTTAGTAITAASGLKSFQGLVTITGGNFTSNNTAPLEFQAGISNAGTLNQSGAGTVTFTGTQTISGAGAVTFAGPVTASADLNLAKTAGAVTFSNTLTVTGDLDLSSSSTSTVSGVGTVGSLTTSNGTTLTIGANNFTVSGTASLGGLMVDNNSGGTDTFTGAFSILSTGELRELIGVSSSPWTFGSTFSNAGTFNNTSNGSVLTFNDDITNTGTFIRTGATSGGIIFNNTILFSSTSSIAITTNPAWTINGATTLSFGGNALSTGGSLTINTGGSLDAGDASLTISGTTTLVGTAAITDNSNTGTNTFTGLVTVPATASFSTSNNSNFNFAGGIANDGTFSISGSGNVNLTATQTVSGTGAITVPNFSVTAGTTTLSNTGNLTVGGTSTINGVLTVTATAGNKLFTGLVTVGAAGSTTCSTAATFEYRGGITVTGAGTFTNSSTGVPSVNFSTNGQTLAGTIRIDNANISSAVNMTINGTFNTTATGTFTGIAGSNITVGNGGIINWSSTNTLAPPPAALTASGTNATVNYTAAGVQSIQSVTYYNLGISGSGVKSLFADPNVANNLTITGGTLRMNNNNLTTNNLTLGSNGILDNNPGVPATCALLVTGATALNASSQISNMNGPVNAEFQGNIVQGSSGAMIFATGSTTVFSTNNVAISGAGGGAVTFGGSVIINDGITVTSSRAVTITGTLDASISGGQWVNDVNSTLTYSSPTQPFNTTGTLVASASPNTVTYNGASPTIRNTTYHNLTVSSTGSAVIGDITVNNNFTYSGGTAITCVNPSTQTFATSSSGTVSSANCSFNNMVISKAGGNLTVGSNFTAVSSLNITSGTLQYTGTARTVTVSGDLSGAGAINMTGIAGNTLILNGSTNSLGSLTTVTGNTISYLRAGDQTIFGSLNYAKLNIGGSGIKTLGGNVEVNETITFSAAVLLSLASSDLTLGATGTLISSSGAFGLTKMIVTDGAGTFKKEGTTAAHFSAFVTQTPASTGLYPLGTTGYFSPMSITSLAATVAGTGSLSVRAVPSKQPNVPYYNNALIKYWEVASTNLSAITANVNFTFNAAEVIGSVSFYVPRVWDGASLSTVTGPSAPGSNPISTTGTTFLTGDWTAIDPTVRNAYYSYISGDWNTAGTWTTDPSGTTLINSAVPTSGDQVYILNGRTVTNIAAGLTTASLTIENGAVLDIGSTVGHSFGPVSGSGLYRQSTVTLPTATFTNFTSSSGGTFEYYDLPAGTNILSNTLATYNHLLITNTTGTSYIIAQDHDLTINGNFSSSISGAGNVTYSIGNSATNRILSIFGNLTIGTGCTVNVGLFNAHHTLNIYGNLTNSGALSLTNAASAYIVPANGYATTNFRGITNNTTVTANSGSSTKFDNFIVIKNTGYELFVSAAAGATPLFWSQGKTIDVTTGTLRLGANVTVPVLETSGGNYDLGSSSAIPTLWIDGATVTFGSPGGAIVPYGTLRVSAGTLNVLTGQGGIVLRETGQLQIEGSAVVNAQIFRTSTTASTHRGAFYQTGGTFNITGVSGGINYYSMFTLPYPDNVFRMSGGVINITRAFTGGITPNGGIQIASTLGNYDVTGGTINVTTTPGINFEISSSAPLYNLTISKNAGAASQVNLSSINWSYDGSGANTATYPSQPLRILNDFTINTTNSPIFDAKNTDVYVKGNLLVNTSGTFQSTTNTLNFDGTSNQTFTVNGSLSTGLSSLAIDKSTSTLTIAGTAGTITMRGSLTITNGTLADGGKTINVAQNITNNGTHSGAGKIVLNGSANAQTITGTLNSIFGNIDFSNTNGAAGSTQITVSSNLQINGNLGLTTDRVASIGNKQIVLSGTSSITGTFSANRHIKTNGLLSDGGIKKTFSSTAAVTFPVGYGSNYSPATIQFTSAPTTWGSLDIRPVGTKQLYVTDPNCFDLYWKIKTNGFTGIPASSVNYTFNYGSLTDNATYIPAFYDQLAVAYVTINDVTKVDEATNNISFTGVSYTDGDYTAGDPAAFGIVTAFYSRTNGNWNTPSTWSNVGFGGAASGSIPASNSPVLIGDGNLFNHTVTVTTSSTVSGSLIVDAGSTLDCQTTTGNNFGAIPYATAGGSGTIRISSASATAEFPAGDFGLFFESAGGTCEYYSTGTQDFTLPIATASPTVISIDTYKNLILAPGAGRTISMPDKNYIIYNDIEVNGDPTGIASLTNAAARIYTVNHDLNITQGILDLGSGFANTMTVLGDVMVSNGGTLQSPASGSVTHNLYLNGNLTNEGIISLNNASKSNLTFQGSGSRNFDGSNGSASVSLNSLIVNIGSNNSTELDISTLGSFSAPTNNWVTLTSGNLKWSKSGSITLTDAVGDFIIPSAAALTLNHSGLTVNVNQVNSSDADVILLGKLSIQAGTMNIGNSANNRHNDLEVGSAGIAEFEIAGSGVLNVNGEIRRSLVVQSGSLKYTQSGTSSVLVRGKNPDGGGSLSLDRAKFEILNAGSEFNMSGSSTLTIDRSGVVSGVFYDIYMDPSAYNITGGEIRVGTSTTAASQNFISDIQVPLWNLSIDGTTTAKTVTLIGDPLVVQKNLRIEGNSIFVASGLDVTIGGDLVNQNTTSTTGLSNGGFRPVTATQNTTFNSSIANQNITGVSGNLTNFAVITVANTFAGGQLTLGSNTAVRVAGQLNISTGILNTGANLLTALSNVVNNGGHVSSGAGFLVFAGSSSQSIQSGSTASFGSMRISNSAGVVAECPVDLAGTLNFTTGLFYINNYLLNLGVSSTVTGTLNSASMIRLNGVTSDAGVRKSYPASASDFTFPIGVTLKYSPVRMNVTSNTIAGTITIKPVNVKHPATTDPTDLQLNYYWRVASTGFNGSTVVDHTYNYDPLDVTGTEASYVTGRFFGSIWAPTLGIPATVDASNDLFTLSGVNYFDGDYTAGENTEFNIITTFYSRNATSGGNWDDPNAWSIDAILQHAGAAAPTFPNFNQAVIAAGHNIASNGNTRNAVSVVVNGTLDLSNTIAHNFGNVSGTGRIRQTATPGNQYIFPGGDYSAFTTSSGGTFEFGGTTNGTLSTQATYNHVDFTGSATKNLPNANITLNGNLTISAGILANPSNKNISLNGNWTNTVGVGGFTSGNGSVNLIGGSQTLTGSTNFYNLVANGAGDKTLTSSVTATNGLTLTDGIFVTGANQMIVNSTASISGGSATSYVSGNLRRGIPASATTTVFQIGDATSYTPVTINYTGTTVAGGFITANTSSGDHPQVYTSGIDQTKTANRYWTLTNSGVTGFTGYNAAFTFVSGDLDVSANPLNFMVARYSSSTWTQPTVGTITSTSTQGISISGTTFGDFQVGQSVGGKIWTGTTNTNWNVSTNWIPATVPGSGDNAIIGNVPNQPTFISGGNGQCKDLVLLTGAVVTIPTGYTLTVNENIDAAGNTIDGVGDLAINGASSTLTGSLTVNSNLIVNASSTLVLGTGSTLNLGKDFTVNGSLTPNSLPVTFVGTNHSTVSGNIGFYDLVVNKTTSSYNVVLGSDITVSNEVNLLSGNVELNGFELDLGGTGSLVNETSSNRVTGLTGGTIRATRNLNAPTDVDVAGLGAILSSSANMGSTEVIRKHNQVVFGIGYGLNRRYEIHPTNNSSLNAKFVFNYFDDELVTGSGTITETELDLWRFNGTTWDVQHAVLDDIGNTITKTGIPQFSEWTGASEVNNPLPIELAYANITCEGIHPTLSWKTVKETDTRSFQIEVSPDGKNWEVLKSVPAAGNSNSDREYMFELKGIPDGTQMIRLSMLDVNNKLHSYDRMENCTNGLLAKRTISIHPNPTTGAFTVDLNGTSEDVLDVKVFNTLGQSVGGAIHDASRRDKIKMDLQGLPAGIYKVQIAGYQDGIRSFNVVVR